MCCQLKRMMIAYFFFFLITVSLGRCDDRCFELYKTCAEGISNMKGDAPCKIASAVMKCLVETTEICFPSFKDTFQKYKALVDEGCQPRSTFFQNVADTVECITNQSDPLGTCELEGEFDNVAELCSSVSNLINCARFGTADVCGQKSGNTFHKLLRPVQDLLDECKTLQEAKDFKINECYKGLLKCNRRILTAPEYTCNDIERISECYFDVVEKECGINREGIFMKIVRKYVDQIPDYCNPESAVMQNFEKSGACIATKYSVLEPCSQHYQKTVSRTFEGDYESDYDNEYLLTVARAAIEYRDCCVEKLGTACGDEAAFVTRFVLAPFVAVADDTCLEKTGEKCSAAVRVESAILLLILSLKYILTKED